MKLSRMLRLALLAPMILTSACRSPGGERDRSTEPIPLHGTTAPLAGWFAENAGTPRAILLLSPT